MQVIWRYGHRHLSLAPRRYLARKRLSWPELMDINLWRTTDSKPFIPQLLTDHGFININRIRKLLRCNRTLIRDLVQGASRDEKVQSSCSVYLQTNRYSTAVSRAGM